MRHPNIVKKALEHYILSLDSVPAESENKAEAMWEAVHATAALKSMDERVSYVRLLDRFGGDWLGQIRSWMQHALLDRMLQYRRRNPSIKRRESWTSSK